MDAGATWNIGHSDEFRETVPGVLVGDWLVQLATDHMLGSAAKPSLMAHVAGPYAVLIDCDNVASPIAGKGFRRANKTMVWPRNGGRGDGEGARKRGLGRMRKSRRSRT